MADHMDMSPKSCPTVVNMIHGEDTQVEVVVPLFGSSLGQPPTHSLRVPALTPIVDMCKNIRDQQAVYHAATKAPWYLTLLDRTRVLEYSKQSLYTLLPLSKMQSDSPTLTLHLAPPTPPPSSPQLSATPPRAPISRTPGKINVFVRAYDDTATPRTINFPVPPHTTLRDFCAQMNLRLPRRVGTDPRAPIKGNLTTQSGRQLVAPDSTETIHALMARIGVKDSPHSDMLNLRLNVFTPGGKGGFGSQLRAAGGRMSSRKNRRNPEQENASNRNLDGRRLRTITEAKNLAAYLTMKPDMDKKEREEKRKRWEAVVEAAERKEDEIKRGKSNVRLDGQWVEQKEEAEGKTRDAVLAAMKAGIIGNDIVMHERTGSESSAASDEGDSDGGAAGEKGSNSSSSSSVEDSASAGTKVGTAAPASRTFFGWDEDDEDMSSDEEDAEEEEDAAPVPYEGKGKGKAL